MDPVERMRVFLRVAELTSFTQAAATLGLPKASVSTAVADLEAELGTRLLHRTTRRVQLTQDGQVFSKRARELVSDLDELTSHFQDGEAGLRGRLRVDMSTGLAEDLIVPRLGEFLEAHPGIEVELSSTERLVDLAREGFDFTIRAGGRADSNLIARFLGDFHVVNCASPRYLERFGLPASPSDLSGHRLIHYASVFGAPRDAFDFVDPSGGELRTIALRSAITVNSATAYLTACRAGLGLAQIPLGRTTRRLLDAGDLVEVLPGFRAPPFPVSLVYLNRRHQPRRVRVFMDWVASLVTPYLALGH
jgi:DNA-binding transcriptional LysR family regulator